MASTQALLALKAANQSKSIEEKQAADRYRDCLILILEHLRSCGYVESASKLASEASGGLSRYRCADNVDLFRIVREYEEYHEVKYGRKPKFSRKSCDDDGNVASGDGRGGSSARRRRGRQSSRRGTSGEHNGACAGVKDRTSGVLKGVQGRLGVSDGDLRTVVAATDDGTKCPERRQRRIESSPDKNTDAVLDADCGGVTGIALTAQAQRPHRPGAPEEHADTTSSGERERLLKPMPTFDGDMEARALASSIRRDILETSPGVAWDDIIHLDEAKRLLKEAVVMPTKYPQLFTGLLSPWRGVLLFGPPGTGKTLLAKAVATESDATFFNISASTLVSKFRGDSEKMVRMLFELARHHAPSTIFIDEIDSLMGNRGAGSLSTGGEGTEHEGSRRMKTELLIQMDGLSGGSEHIFVLAASNLPWELDPALLRRLEKRIHVPLPSRDGRKDMIRAHFSNYPALFSDPDFLDACADSTEGYSGADIKILCKEGAMRPVRRILEQLEMVGTSDAVISRANVPDVEKLMKRDPVTRHDFEESIKCTRRSTTPELCKKYASWEEEFS